MLGLAAADDRQRTRLSAARFVASGCAALAISGLAALLIRGVTAGTDGVLGGVVIGLGLLAAASLGGIVSQALWTTLARRVSRRRVMEAAAGLMIAGATVFYAGAPLGAAWAIAGALLVGAGLGGLGMATWAALADATAVGGASAGAVFGAFTFASKLGLAVSAVMVSEILAVQPYRGVSSDGAWPLLPLMCLAPIAGATAYLGLARRVDLSR